jgi:hypothetical protein
VSWPREQMGQPWVAAYSIQDMTYFLSWSWHDCNGKTAFLESNTQRRKLLVECLSRFSGLALGGKNPGDCDREAAPILSHMSYRFSIGFMFFLTPRPCESLRRPRKPTTDSATWVRLLFLFVSPRPSLPLSIFGWPLWEETGTGYGVGRVKDTFIMANTDLERKSAGLKSG